MVKVQLEQILIILALAKLVRGHFGLLIKASNHPFNASRNRRQHQG